MKASSHGEHSPRHTHTTPTHLLPTQMLHSASSSVGCKLQDLALHMTGAAALGSQLMLLTVESVYESVYFKISLDQ